jgi:N-acetylneuraminic acid mutarotase
MKKTLIYGGIGQRSTNDRIERFSDMWSFDGNGWTEMKSITTTPGQRYGAQVAVDPQSNTVWLFGGLLLVIDGLKQSQVYSNDLWQWDGTKWTQVDAGTAPPQRENGGLAFDPISNQFVLFGGYAGYYRSDVWGLRNGQWVSQPETLPQPRRRGVKH